MCMTVLLGPAVIAVTPANYSSQYYGLHGYVNTTYANYGSSFQTPVVNSANSSSGFGAASLLTSSALTPLAFIYGGISILWSSLYQMPTIMWSILTSVTSGFAAVAPGLVVVGLAEIASIVFFSYVMMGNVLRLILWWMKSSDTSEMVGG